MNRQNEQTRGHGEQAGDCWRGGGGWADRRKDEGGRASAAVTERSKQHRI